MDRFKDVSEKEFEKYKFSLVSHGRMTAIGDEFTFNSSDFINNIDTDSKPCEFTTLSHPPSPRPL